MPAAVRSTAQEPDGGMGPSLLNAPGALLFLAFLEFLELLEPLEPLEHQAIFFSPTAACRGYTTHRTGPIQLRCAGIHAREYEALTQHGAKQAHLAPVCSAGRRSHPR